MKDLSDFFEAIIFFGEIGIGQIGLQVISISLGRRGSGEWKAQDSVRFWMMIFNSITGIFLCYIPFYIIRITPIDYFEFIYYLILISTSIISLYSCYLIYIYSQVRKFADFTSGGALTTVYSITFIINIVFVLSIFGLIRPDIWLFYFPLCGFSGRINDFQLFDLKEHMGPQ